MEKEEWLDRLDEVQRHAKTYGNKKAADDLFRPGSDGKPLTSQERKTLQQYWEVTRRDEEVRRHPI